MRGYKKEAVDLADLQYFDNDDYANTGELASLYTARDFLDGDVVIAYGDIIFDEFILHSVLTHPGNINVAVDGSWKLRERTDTKRDLVITSGTNDPIHPTGCVLEAIGDVAPEQATGEWIGLLFVRGDQTRTVVRMLDRMAEEEPAVLRIGGLPALLQRLIGSGETVSGVHTYGHWYDLDEQKDLLAASSQITG